MKTLSVAVLVLVCLVATPARCQSVTNTMHVHGQETIDGSKHPELIPDAIAYHLVLIHYANSLSRFVDLSAVDVSVRDQGEEAIHRTLGAIGLSKNDRNALVGVMANYRAQHKSAIALLSQGDDYRSLRDQAAIAARAELQRKLSTEGYKRFDAFVQSQKSQMSVAAK